MLDGIAGIELFAINKPLDGLILIADGKLQSRLAGILEEPGGVSIDCRIVEIVRGTEPIYNNAVYTGELHQ
jgi:hypothetical protein